MKAAVPARAATLARTRDRGSLSMFAVLLSLGVFMLAGLVLDGGTAIAARQRAADVAEQAARYGADEVDVPALRAGRLQVDEGSACGRAADVVAGAGDGAAMTGCGLGADGSVQVEVAIDTDTVLLGLVGYRALHARSTALAQPCQGIVAGADASGEVC